MCGRYTVFTQTDDNLMLKFLAQAGFFSPMAEISPTDAAPVLVALSDGKIKSRCAYWGFPSPAGKGKPVINSRCETAQSKRFFSDALANRRCVIPATGFFEWSYDGQLKYIFRQMNSDILYMAGAYNEFGARREFVIFTRDADEDVSDIHNRMPVLVSDKKVREYLCSPFYYQELFISPPPPLSRALASG